MESRCISNNFSPLLSLTNPDAYMQEALEDIVTNHRPRDKYEPEMLAGLWHGPTGLAYLFLHVSAAHPHLKVGGHHALTWAKRYIHGSRGHVRLESKHCGIASEKLAYEAVKASISKDLRHVQDFLSCMEPILRGGYPNELLYGRAGTLYFLRMIRHWVPESASLVEKAIAAVSQKIMADGPDWEWHGKRYLGAVHGDISILTQLVLTTPGVSQQLEPKLVQLLEMQRPDGNWPSSVGKESHCLTQFCHGAPGFVISLVSLRPYFLQLEERINLAIEVGRECIWREGLLRKEPNLCHGIFGNALALSFGRHRDHFLAMAAPESVRDLRKTDKNLFTPADYGVKYSTTTSYAPSAAWTYMMHGKDSPKIIAYNDI